MKYMIMGASARGEHDRISAEEQNRRVRHHQQKLDELLRARVIGGRSGLIFASVGLGPFHDGDGTTVTVKNRSGKHLHVDGPFPETKEVIGGFDIIDFASVEEAIEYAKGVHHETSVGEVRPIREFWWISQFHGASAGKQFMLTSVEDEHAVMGLPESEREQIMRQHQAVGAEYISKRGMRDQKPGLWVGARLGLSNEAKTIRRGGRQVTDGPFVETKEVTGGFNLIACDSITEAVGWAEKIASREGETIEIRPVDGGWWIYHE